MKCIVCKSNLKGKQIKYCSNKCINKKWKDHNKEYNKKYAKEYRKNNREKLNKLTLLSYYRNKQTCFVREYTNRKYGKAIKCWVCGSEDNVQHHHYTRPYHVDEFIDLCQNHHLLANKVEV